MNLSSSLSDTRIAGLINGGDSGLLPGPDVIIKCYALILLLFILGGAGFFLINRRTDPKSAGKNRIKFITYFIIINAFFFSILYAPPIFRFFVLLIIFTGLYEMITLFLRSGPGRRGFFAFSLFLFALLSAGFFHFSSYDRGLILYSYLVLAVFDAFSQVCGQLTGRTKILPRISPSKTLEGFIGGTVFAVAVSLLLKDLILLPAGRAAVVSAGIVITAFAGDLAGSYYKRQYNAKDFGNLLPGHGGFLDRFDSFIATGASVAFLHVLAD